jgi:antitoxin component of RelBE/YafQ-DinJ toxin-antitoxin module
MEARVNLRIANETYAPYIRLAAVISDMGIPMTPTHLIRLFLEAQVEQTEVLATLGEAAKRGDRDAARKLWDAVMDLNQAQLNVARAAAEVEGGLKAAG